MGIAIGAAMPVLLSAIGANVDGKRTAMVYLVVEVAGVDLLGGGILSGLTPLVPLSILHDASMTSVSIAFVNTLFRFVKVVILLPFTDVDREGRRPPGQGQAASRSRGEPEAIRLEERFIQHPALAIEQSRITINSMAAEAERNFVEARWRCCMTIPTRAIDRGRGWRASSTATRTVSARYLVKLTGRELSARSRTRTSRNSCTRSPISSAFPTTRSTSPRRRRRCSEKSITFSDDALRMSLAVLETALARDSAHTAIRAFISNDLQLAARVEPLEELIDDLCDEMKLHHVDRLQKGTLYARPGLCVQRSADQLRARGRPLLQHRRRHDRAGVGLVRYARVSQQRQGDEIRYLRALL